MNTSVKPENATSSAFKLERDVGTVIVRDIDSSRSGIKKAMYDIYDKQR